MASRKGRPNKIGAQVKSTIISVFDRIGGVHTLAEWAKENLTEFYRLYARLIPTDITATIDRRDASELSNDELSYIASAGRAGDIGEEAGGEEVSSVH